MKKIFLIGVFTALLVINSGVAANVQAAELSAQQKAQIIISSAEKLASGYRAYYEKYKKLPESGINGLITSGIISEYPKTSHQQSDFYATAELFEEGAGATYYVRYSINESTNNHEICRALNVIALGLKPDAPLSSVSFAASPKIQNASTFAQTPPEIVGKDAFCLAIGAYSQFFLKIMPVNW